MLVTQEGFIFMKLVVIWLGWVGLGWVGLGWLVG
jgi:hypothetical protein